MKGFSKSLYNTFSVMIEEISGQFPCCRHCMDIGDEYIYGITCAKRASCLGNAELEQGDCTFSLFNKH